MPFFAKFSKPGADLLRQDTRFYFDDIGAKSPGDSCIGTIFLCNPGSAKGTTGRWGPLEPDPTLGVIESILRAAVARKGKDNSQFELPKSSYVEILNCCYVCSGSRAPTKCRCGIRQPVQGAWVWVAWGNIASGAMKKEGRTIIGQASAFWFESGSVKKGKGVPASVRAVHPSPHPLGWKRHYPDYEARISEEIAARLLIVPLRNFLQSEEEYLCNEIASPVRREFIAGYTYARPDSSYEHARISSNILGAIGLRLRGQRCQAFGPDMKVRIQADEHVHHYYPDAMVVCDRSGLAPGRHWTDKPAVIFEVLSESTRRIDEGEKALLYWKVLTLTAYILVEQDKVQVTVRRRDGGGEVLSGRDTLLRLPELGLEIPLGEFYERLPL